jgi:hypothetical protein
MRPLLPHDQLPVFPHVFNVMPPLRVRPGGPAPVELHYLMVAEGATAGNDKHGLKERNRVAAQKSRERKDRYLSGLEERNHGLRKQAFELGSQLQLLKLETDLLDREFEFFQGLMSKLMGGPV